MKAEEQPKISVVIRKRPLNKKEIQRNQTDVISVKNGQTVIVSEYKQKVDLTKYIEESIFNFDFAFDQTTTNEQVYTRAVRPLVESAFLGAKVTCFAYGQTGSGKTHTMNGDMQNGIPGLYILGAHDLFEIHSQPQHQKLKVYVSFFEIYCGKLFDLLNNRTELKIRQDNKQNVHIVGIDEHQIYSPQEFMNSIAVGSALRVTSENSTNAVSSRSHAILQITLKEGKKTFGKISFIDLAGSQRGADHMDQNKQTRIDGAQINKSLLALKECIRALDQGKGHTPFRGSKLTMVLKDSFVGFCKTVMIGNISPGLQSCQNTLNTLRYADRVKQLKKGGGNNQSQSISREDQLAKQLMLPRMNKNAVKIVIQNGDDAQDIQLKKQEAHQKLGLNNPKPMQNQSLMFNQPKLSLNNNIMQNQSMHSYNQKKVEQPKVKKYTIAGDNQQKRSQSANHKTLNNNLVSNTKAQVQNPYDISKTINIKHQTSPSTTKVQMNSSVTTKLLPNQKSMQESEETIPTKVAYNNYQRVNSMKEKDTVQQRHGSLNSRNNMINQFSGPKNSMGTTNPSTEALRFIRTESQQHQKQQQNRRRGQQIKWQQVVADFRDWHPSNQNQLVHFKQSHEFLISKLIEEEDQITGQHSITINRQIQVIKQQMKFIADIEKDKCKYESIEYVEFMQNCIDTKLKSLLQLKKKVNIFKQKLLEHQQCEQKIFMAKDQLAEQQLLDDLDNYQTEESY